MSLFSPTSGSRGAVEAREGISRGACERLNLHRTASAGPAASFNLRLSEILPGPSEDSGMISFKWRTQTPAVERTETANSAFPRANLLRRWPVA